MKNIQRRKYIPQIELTPIIIRSIKYIKKKKKRCHMKPIQRSLPSWMQRTY